MKKLMSLILTAVLLTSALVIPAGAAEADNSHDDCLYYDEFFNWSYPNYAEIKEKFPNYNPQPLYSELYIHRTDGEPDWALVCGQSGASMTMVCSEVIMGRAIETPECCSPFFYTYGIYDVAQNRFYDINNIGDGSQYPGLDEVLEEFNIGEKVVPVTFRDGLLYLDSFIKKAKKDIKVDGYNDEDLIKCYDELYYHYTDGIIDWAIVKAEYFFQVVPARYYYTRLDNRIFRNDRIIEPFYNTSYCVYKVSTDSFVKLEDRMVNPDSASSANYPGLMKAIRELNLGEIMGDLNSDGKLNINDATEMQYCLAKLHSFPESDGVEAAGRKKYGDFQSVKYMSDVDGNGKRDISDVTAIQKQIAKGTY